MFSPNEILPYHLVKRSAECDALDEMLDEMRDLLLKSCAAYGINSPEQAKKGENGFGWEGGVEQVSLA